MSKPLRASARLAAAFGVVLVAASASTAATFTLYTSEAAWLAAVTNVETFATTASNLALADEPNPNGSAANNDVLSGTLTFQSTSTGLSRSFQVHAMQYVAQYDSLGGRIFTFNDNEIGPSSPPQAGFENALSPNDIDNGEDDDVRWESLSGPALTAFAFDLGDNNSAAGEVIRIYDGATLLATLSGLPVAGGGFAFVGVVGDTPFTRVEYDEDTGPDDVSVANFRFADSLSAAAVPEPGPAGFVLACALLLVSRRQR